MANTNLKEAKAAKNDEFYTQFHDIEIEMNAYLEYDPDVFRGHLDIWGDKLSVQTQGWTFRVIERQQSSARTALGPSRPQRLICSRRRSYIPATVPRVSSVV